MIGWLTMQLEMVKKCLEILGLSTEGKRSAVKRLVKVPGYPVGQACQLLGLSRSTFYYHRHRAEDRQLMADVEAVVGQ
jgi:hypothetical protein